MTMISETHDDLFTRPIIASIATAMPSGRPQVTPVWCDAEDGYVLVNTAAGRQKDRNVQANPRVTVLVIDPDNPYRWIEVRGTVAERTAEGAVDHINSLSMQYDNKPYPTHLLEVQERLIYKIKPDKINTGDAKRREPVTPASYPFGESDLIPDEYVDLLAGPVVVNVSTVMPNGRPQSTPVWVSYQDGQIWLNTAEGRQKDRNLQANPLVTVLAIDPQNVRRWIEVRGKVVERTTDGAVEHIDQLTQLYAGLETYFGAFHSAEARATMTRVIYKIQPEKTVYQNKS